MHNLILFLVRNVVYWLPGAIGAVLVIVGLLLAQKSQVQ